MSSSKRGSKLRSENIASNTGPSPMEELYNSAPCVQFLVEATPFWEPIRLKYLDSNQKFSDITGYTHDELQAPGFDFLKLVISDDYQIRVMKWFDDYSVNCKHSPYKLIFTLQTLNGPSDYMLADCKMLPYNYLEKIRQYHIAGIMIDDLILPFENVEKCYKLIARREFKSVYDSLTELQKKLLHALCEGYSSKVAKDIICRSKPTVDRQRAYMIRKFKKKNCAELIASMKQMGIL